MSSNEELSERDRAVLNSIFNPNLPLGEGIFEDEDTAVQDEELLDSNTNIEINELEVKAIKMAENGQYEESLQIFEKMLNILPERSSTYNNRAQVYRLQGNPTAGLPDLSRAIKISGSKGKTGRLALCQRGIIYRRDGRDEEAMEDFKQAATLGSSFAKQQMVEMNPYAALCNQMLRQVMGKLN